MYPECILFWNWNRNSRMFVAREIGRAIFPFVFPFFYNSVSCNCYELTFAAFCMFMKKFIEFRVLPVIVIVSCKGNSRISRERDNKTRSKATQTLLKIIPIWNVWIVGSSVPFASVVWSSQFYKATTLGFSSDAIIFNKQHCSLNNHHQMRKMFVVRAIAWAISLDFQPDARIFEKTILILGKLSSNAG